MDSVPGLKVDGEARIIHSDRQNCYDGNLSNRLSRGHSIGKDDDHNKVIFPVTIAIFSSAMDETEAP